MNKLTIIGGLTRDPELKTTQSGIQVCVFTVAVSRKRTSEGQPDADFFRVTAWRQLGENCAKYLAKGRKVCVIGPVSLSTYKGKDGAERANLEVTADDVEFLTPRDAGTPSQGTRTPSGHSGSTSPRVGGNEEERYLKEEREAIRHENEYVDATPENVDDLPFD